MALHQDQFFPKKVLQYILLKNLFFSNTHNNNAN
jgi:hypothetical protein